jgi:glycosyltransferase involved in cell wall biosynthesis
MRARIVVPARNESASLPQLLAELAASCSLADVLVVDDASTDGTAALLRSVGVPHLRLRLPVGVGGAMRAGLRAARRDGYDAAVRLDGDGQHPPAAIAPLLAELRRGADAVQARRDPTGYRAGAGRRALAALVRAWLAGPLGRRVADPTSGLWAFGPRALALLSEEHPRGYPEPALLLLLERRGLRVAEIPVAMRARSAGHSSLTVRRAALALWCVALSTATMPRRRPAALTHG